MIEYIKLCMWDDHFLYDGWHGCSRWMLCIPLAGCRRQAELSLITVPVMRICLDRINIKLSIVSAGNKPLLLCHLLTRQCSTNATFAALK